MSNDNSTTPPETLDAFVAQMRRWDKEGIFVNAGYVANCVETAAERERDETRQLAAIAESDESFARCARCDRPERDSAPGNAAAIREALLKVLECYKSGAIRTEYNDPDSWKHDDELCYLKDDVEAALAAPARNCDRFENWMQAWDGYLAKYPDASHGKPFEIGRFHVWLFAPAEGGDAGEEAR